MKKQISSIFLILLLGFQTAHARFTQADTWQGIQHQPITLNKYTYANVDPVNNVDPTGNFSLGSFGVASNIQVTLGELQANSGFSLIDSLLTGESQSASAVGIGVIASMSPSILKFAGRKINSTFIGQGKVAFPKTRKPLQKEIDSAEFLAQKQGAKIYIRGGKNTQGADFFLNGKKWELKTLNRGTESAVFNNIRKAIDKNQSNLIIIDGLKAGLTRGTLKKGIARAQRNGKNPSQIKAILGNGQIYEWP